MVKARSEGNRPHRSCSKTVDVARLLHADETQPLENKVEKLSSSLRVVAVACGMHEAWSNVVEPWVRHTGRIRSTHGEHSSTGGS